MKFVISYIIICIICSCIQFQLPIILKNQIYQYPLNMQMYRNLEEVEKPSEILALPIISINIGTPPQRFNLVYSTATQVLWVLNPQSTNALQNSYDMNNSSTCEKNQGNYEMNSYTYGTLCSSLTDYVSLNGEINNIRFQMNFFLSIHITHHTLLADGELGMMRKYSAIFTDPYITKNASEYSLIDKLKENNIISKRVFAHEYINKTNGVLYIGETPNITNESYNIYKCESVQKGEPTSFWNCEIKGVNINKTNINATEDKIAVLSTGEKFIFIPESNRDVIEVYRNSSQWGRDNCVFDEHVSYVEMHCDYKNFKYSYFSNIIFRFENFEIELTPEEIFYYNYNKKYYRLLIVLFNKKNYWILGSPALKRRNMIFNGENNTVTFFEKKIKKNNHTTMIIVIIVCVCVLITLVAWFILRRSMKKIKNENVEKLFFKL